MLFRIRFNLRQSSQLQVGGLLEQVGTPVTSSVAS
jgi:hypothetical protein